MSGVTAMRVVPQRVYLTFVSLSKEIKVFFNIKLATINKVIDPKRRII